MKGEKIVKVSLNVGMGYQARVAKAPSFKCNAETSRAIASTVLARVISGQGKRIPTKRVANVVLAVANRNLSPAEKRGIRAIFQHYPKKSLVTKINEAAQIASGQATAHLRPSVATAKPVSRRATAPVESIALTA